MIHIKLDKAEEEAGTKMIRRRPLKEAVLSIIFRTLASFSRLINIIFIPRYLSREFYGLYSFYMSRFVTLLTVLQSPIRFWTYREESYGLKVSRASLKASLIVSTIAYVISLIILFLVYNVPLILSVLAASLGSLYIFYDILVAISNVYRPHITQLAFLILRVTQATLIIVLVLSKSLTIENLFTIVIICYLISIMFLLLQFKNILRESKANLKECLKRWFKKSYIPIIDTVAAFIYSIDAFYMTKLLGFSYVAGFFLTLAVVYNIQSICGSAAQGLTSYLLMTRDIERSRIYTYLTLIIAIPSYIFIFFYPWYIIAIYGYKYVKYLELLKIMSIYGLLFMILNLLILVGMGIDSTDIQYSTFNIIKKSTSFKIQLVRLIIASLYISTFISLTYYLYTITLNPLLMIYVWALALIARVIVEIVTQYIYSLRKVLKLKDAWKIILKPLIISLLASIIVAIILSSYENSISIISLSRLHLYQLLFIVFEKYIIFLFFSILICVIVDKDFRNITKRIIKHLSRRIS